MKLVVCSSLKIHLALNIVNLQNDKESLKDYTYEIFLPDEKHLMLVIEDKFYSVDGEILFLIKKFFIFTFSQIIERDFFKLFTSTSRLFVSHMVYLYIFVRGGDSSKFDIRRRVRVRI